MLKGTVRVLIVTLALIAMLVAVRTLPGSAQMGPQNGEWPYWNGDAGSTKYSPLDQINGDNVKNLRIAWRWKADNFGPKPDFNNEVTPIMIGGVLYATAGSRRDVVAIDGATGETLWMYRHDDGERGQKAPVRSVSGRGVGYWTDGRDARILHVTPGYYLVELDAKTGQPVPGFGKDGVVDLYEGLDRPVPPAGQIGWNSPPMAVGNIIVVGAALGGGPNKEFVAGSVRGYDVRTGKRAWIFHTIPQPGEVGNDTWEGDSWSYTGHTGSWGAMSADTELGYVYAPIETPTSDYYGGHRPGNNVFAESIVCLDAKTGKRVWHYQLVHHGIWDYDIPTPPVLADITVGGRRIKAVVVMTKQAFTYVFDRVTGQPVWPIEERPVPQSDVPGEKTSKTQPIPTKPPPFDRQGLTADDLIDFTPELKAEALKIASRYRMGPLFTPPSLVEPNGTKGSWVVPGGIGGTNWQGGAFDPETGMLYVPSITSPRAVAITKGDPQRGNMAYVGGFVGGFSGAGRLEEGNPGPEGGPQGLPIVKPPWGRITAIDLNKGEHAWMVPNGETPDFVKNHPALKGVVLPKTGQPGRAGVLVTKTLLFVGEGSNVHSAPPGASGQMLRALDKKTGQTIFEFKLPKPQGGIAMSYMLGGKQYIVAGVGAMNEPTEFVALSLP